MKKRVVIAAVAAALVLVGGAIWQLQAAPSIGAVAANPAYVVINTPTQILFTAHIADPSVIPSGVNLLQVDAAGKTLGIVGTLRDDGANGDVRAGDKVFSIRVPIHRSSIGLEYYRISAAFRGVLQRLQSPSINVYLDPFPLPPDPGEAGKQTREGIDSDQDGVRDDIQRYIAIELRASTPAQRDAAYQHTEAIDSIINDDQHIHWTIHAERITASTRCLAATFGPREAYAVTNQLFDVVANTEARRQAFFEVQREFGGFASDAPRTSELAQFCSNR